MLRCLLLRMHEEALVCEPGHLSSRSSVSGGSSHTLQVEIVLTDNEYTRNMWWVRQPTPVCSSCCGRETIT